MDAAVLADLELCEMEAERLHLPDQVLQLAIGGASRPCAGQGVLYDSKLVEELVGVAVGKVSVPFPRCAQPLCGDGELLPMRLTVRRAFDLLEQPRMGIVVALHRV